MVVRKNKPGSHKGFTLIEILITLVIIGIVATFAVLAVGDFGQSQRIEAAAEELDLLLELAQQQAILQPAVLGLTIDDKGYRFFQYQLDYESLSGKWQALSRDNVLRYHAFPKSTAVTINTLNENINLAATYGTNRPTIIISPSGNMTPFKIEMGKPDKSPLFRITGALNGEITITEL